MPGVASGDFQESAWEGMGLLSAMLSEKPDSRRVVTGEKGGFVVGRSFLCSFRKKELPGGRYSHFGGDLKKKTSNRIQKDKKCQGITTCVTTRSKRG